MDICQILLSFSRQAILPDLTELEVNFYISAFVGIKYLLRYTLRSLYL